MALNTQLSLRLRDNPTAAKHFSLEQLNALEKSFLVVAPDQAKPVFYGDSPPSDRNQPWQQTLADGVTPVGEVLLFQGGEWRGGSPCGPVSPTPPWTAPAPIPTPEPDPDFPGPYWSDGPGDPTPADCSHDHAAGVGLHGYPSVCVPGDWCVHDMAWLPPSGPDVVTFEYRVFNDRPNDLIVYYAPWGTAGGNIYPTPSGIPPHTPEGTGGGPVVVPCGSSVLFTVNASTDLVTLGSGSPIRVYVSFAPVIPGVFNGEDRWYYLP